MLPTTSPIGVWTGTIPLMARPANPFSTPETGFPFVWHSTTVRLKERRSSPYFSGAHTLRSEIAGGI